MLAHSNVAVTQKRYDHLADSSLHKGFDKLARLIEDATAHSAPEAVVAGK